MKRIIPLISVNVSVLLEGRERDGLTFNLNRIFRSVYIE
ncbi:hypothetical protein J2S11_004183 [Bacillus horti]|uniref:Uncharacterized protein n=1 Tax=Caldalkalibacillus horti TaxID=77523 RepID=A0ABT9W520_9BACI|nr:hypothetical protein [Bacillus horti]